ncbi:uncharacterized protein FTOL_07542 [Fusarium torulosum]|uniref:BTB domain-containing protein n=1 Tax=Fusarium torulosum TaxID=33205 RepID=A0AAE8MAZ5_9HYPO|nr:uncharacterized protein FTOL_07542 [Fusarium torulosum]
MSQSPYYGSVVKIRFGGKMTALIPRHIITKHPKFVTFLASLETNKGYDFTDVNRRVGHVLLHFLFTREYQALPMVEETTEKTRKEKFSEVINVYLEASQMGLDGLVTLSGGEIERQGKNITSAEEFAIIDKDFRQDAINGEWLKRYLLRRASNEYEEVKLDDVKKIQQGPIEERNLVSLLLKANMELRGELQKYTKLSSLR